MNTENQSDILDSSQHNKSQAIVDGGQSVKDFKQTRDLFSPINTFLITILGIAMAEVIAMIVVYFFQHLPYVLQTLMDATVMVVIIFPLLYFLSFRPLLDHIQKNNRAANITQARLRLIEFTSTHAWDSLMQIALNEVEALTRSNIGFLHFLESDQKTLSLQAWSTNTLQNMCKAEGKGTHYDLEQAGVWADCARQRIPIVYNNYPALASRKGLPDGHAPITRLLTVPILRNNTVVAILGVGNKPQNYNENDIELVSAFADFAWDVIGRRRAEDALVESEEKFRTLVEWTYDWAAWIDPQQNIVYISPSCERITGYSPAEFIANPDLLTQVVHPQDRQFYEEHVRLAHDELYGARNIEYRIIARDGRERWIEHVCRPLFAADNRYLGRRISNRDITERKQSETAFRERDQKEHMLTQTIQTMRMDIARDLHDTVGQNVSYLRMKLDYLSEKGLQAQTDLDAEIRNMSAVANETYDLVRGMLALLHSENTADLLDLFKRFAGQVSERSTFEIDFTSYGDPRPLSAHQMRQLFYIFREALSNIEKHANASHASVELTWDIDNLVFVVYDNGMGFDANQPRDAHYGIKFMQERASQLNGALHVYSEPGAGTNIVIHAPYENGQLTRPENNNQFMDEANI